MKSDENRPEEINRSSVTAPDATFFIFDFFYWAMAVILVFMALALFEQTYDMAVGVPAYEQYLEENYIKTTGKLIELRQYEDKLGRRTMFCPRIEFTDAQGKRVITDARREPTRCGYPNSIHESERSKYQVGDSLPIRYRPESPEMAELVIEKNPYAKAFLCLATGIIILLSLGGMVFWIRRKKLAGFIRLFTMLGYFFAMSSLFMSVSFGS